MEYNSKSEEIPVINGILYADGSIQHLCISCDEKHRRYIEKNSCIEEEIEESYIGISMTWEDSDYLHTVTKKNYHGQ